MSSSEFNFEQAFSRLETILEKMDSGNTSLDESLQLYEEADRLINNCDSRLTNAEKRIETLIKQRDLSLELDENNNPKTANFDPDHAQKTENLL